MKFGNLELMKSTDFDIYLRKFTYNLDTGAYAVRVCLILLVIVDAILCVSSTVLRLQAVVGNVCSCLLSDVVTKFVSNLTV